MKSDRQIIFFDSYCWRGVIVSENWRQITTSELARRLLLSFSVINAEGAEYPTVNVISSRMQHYQPSQIQKH